MPAVVVELGRERGIIERAAVFAAARMVVALFVGRDGERVVTRHKQIKVSVAVVVQKGGAYAEGILAETALPGHVRKGSIAVIVIEEVRAEV